MGWRIRLDVGEKKDPLLEGLSARLLDPHTPVSSVYRRVGQRLNQKRRGERRIVGGVEIGIGVARGTLRERATPYRERCRCYTGCSRGKER